jgi:hypothetical protein
MAIIGLLISLGAVAQDNAAILQAKKMQDEAAVEQARDRLLKLAAESAAIGPDRAVVMAPVTGSPYSADEVTTFSQTLGDGTRIQREDKVTVYRDSQGRTRRETPTEITITDPSTGVAYSLDPAKLTARKMMVMTKNVQFTYADAAQREAKAPTTLQGMIALGPGGRAAVVGGVEWKAAGKSQSLGTQSIEGVLSEGTSTTETIPAGSIGNDRVIQVVDERWYSPELGTTMMTKHSDPRTGEEVFRLTNIRRGEPSPELFQLPAGYQVIETPGSQARPTKE